MIGIPGNEVRVAHAKEVLVLDRGCLLGLLYLFDIASANVACLARLVEVMHRDILTIVHCSDHQLRRRCLLLLFRIVRIVSSRSPVAWTQHILSNVHGEDRIRHHGDKLMCFALDVVGLDLAASLGVNENRISCHVGRELHVGHNLISFGEAEQISHFTS